MWGRMVKCRVVRFFKTEDLGAATAEFATVLPAVVALAALILYLTSASVVSMQCQDEAASIARQVMVQENNGQIPGSSNPSRISVSLKQEGDSFEVITKCSVLPDPMHVLPKVVEGNAKGVRQ